MDPDQLLFPESEPPLAEEKARLLQRTEEGSLCGSTGRRRTVRHSASGAVSQNRRRVYEEESGIFSHWQVDSEQDYPAYTPCDW